MFQETAVKDRQRSECGAPERNVKMKKRKLQQTRGCLHTGKREATGTE